MELIIKIDNKKVYESLVQFLKSLNISIIAENKPKTVRKNNTKEYPLDGTLLKYDDPFGPATKISDWKATK